MKNSLLKIFSLFFLTILLSSNVLNVHVYLHQQEENFQFSDGCADDDDNQDDPCDLCLLALNLNELDYNNSLEYSYHNDSQIIHNYNEELIIYKQSNYELFYSEYGNNKAPPYLI